jgi:hypothetical protein
MAQAGFEDVGFARRMLGTVGIHWATKGPRPCHTTAHDTGTRDHRAREHLAPGT